MALPGGFLGRFFGNTIGNAAAYGIGGAIQEPLRPLLLELEMLNWQAQVGVGIIKPPPALTLALGVAQGQVDEAAARAWAAQTGFGGDQFSALIDIANTGPGSAFAFELWRRGVINETAFRRAIKRLGVEAEWITDLTKIKDILLSPAELAVMVQRGIVPNDNLLPVGPPTGIGKVSPMPMIDVDAVTEALGSGVNRERLAGLARIIGLPASPDLAARMAFRGIIDKTDFDRAISEGNTRNEWRDFLYEGFRQIPTAHDGVELHLRGWTDPNGMYAQTARHGMSQADTDILFKITGRPISFHQVFIGERRGGTYDGPTAGIDAAFLKSLRESNIRPEWYNLAWAQRHSYPSAFVLRALTQAGDLSQAESKDILLFIGWPESLADKVSKRWAGTGGAAVDPHVAKAQNQLWTRLHSSYLAGETETAQATASLAGIGVSAGAIPEVLGIWNAERGLIRKQLSPAQVKKAYAEAVINPQTGVAWTHDDAIGELVQRGYSLADATTFLEL